MVTDDTVFDIATAPKRNSKIWERGTVTWGGIKEWMLHPGDTKEAGNYVLGVLAGNRRLKSTIRTRCAVTLDADSPSDGFEQTLRDLLDCSYIVHTTFSSTPSKPRFRVIIPLSRTVIPQEYSLIVDHLVKLIGESSFDPGSSQAERYMFKPAAPDPDYFWYEVHEGAALDADEVLDNWEGDLDDIPTPSVSHRKRDPLSLKGTTGYFNNAYTDLDELVEKFELPYELVAPGRYRFVGASGAPGMGEIDGSPNLYFSHHSHDPVYGQAVSAFDLVRIHRFGDLDEGAPDNTPINRLPSTEAMSAFAAADPRVTRLADKAREKSTHEDFYSVVGDEMAEEMSDIANTIDPDAWKDKLEREKKSAQPLDTITNMYLIADNDPMFKGYYKNDMSMSMEAEWLPWRSMGKDNQLYDADRDVGRAELERKYGLRYAENRWDQMMSYIGMKRSWNPVREYLEGLRWDNVSRIETCLPGVRSTAYTRMVARKSLVAAVARILDPGVKWDHMLMIYGKQGLGKSHWMERMGKGWQENLEKIDSNDTLMTMAKSWIMIADEGHAVRKAEFDQLKEFITKRKDTYREPYARSMVTVPRHNVFWGSTNDRRFLRREEGNRRFLVVEAQDRWDFDSMTDYYVDQVWAEAVHLYNEGESLLLTEVEMLTAEEMREEFTQEDPYFGVIQGYLDSPVPSDWDKQSAVQHISYLDDLRSGVSFDTGEETKMTRVCALQVWVEALGNRIGDQNPWEIAKIAKTLREMDGWVQLPGRHTISDYGQQVVFERIAEGVEYSSELSDLI